MRMKAQSGEGRKLPISIDLKLSKRRFSTVGFLTAKRVKMKILLIILLMNQIKP
jgi:hypothetical protein